MVRFLFYLFQEVDENDSYGLRYSLGELIGEYGAYIGATLLVLIILIILYIKKHRQGSKDND